MAMATATALAIGTIAANVGSQVGPAIIGSRANSRAAEAQERAAREAIQYQREQEWRGRMDARSQYDNYMRSVYGDRYQPAGRPTAPAAVPVPGAAPVVPGVTPTPTEPVLTAPLPTAQPVAEAPLVGSPAADQARSLADLNRGWSASNYSRYLGGRR